MTNKEWLIKSLTDEEILQIVIVNYTCKCCVGQNDLKKCLAQPCREGMLKWLKQEHKGDKLC